MFIFNLTDPRLIRDMRQSLYLSEISDYDFSMANKETLKALCFDANGQTLHKDSCRANMINHLILDELMDVDEAEDLVEKTIQELDLWKDEEVIHDKAVDEDVKAE